MTPPLNIRKVLGWPLRMSCPKDAGGQLGRKRIVNDMSIQVATVNGSGSQSSNTVLLRAIFQMGVPVSGKNLFPSNIAGLPTWYTIRANKDGYIGRKKEIDFLVAMNAETAQDDVMSLAPGASVLYDEPLALDKLRNDLIFYSVPYDKIVATVCPEAKLRKLVKNMVYVGVVAQLARNRNGGSREGDSQAVREKSKGREFESCRSPGRIRLRQGQSAKARRLLHRAHEQDRGQNHHRRQLRRRSRLHVCRMHGRHLVSHHAVIFAGRDDDRVHERVSHRPRWQSHLRHRAGRRRTRRHRHGHRRRLGRRSQHDRDRRSRHFADVGIRRSRLLRGSPRRHLGHPARRSLNRPAHAHFARRHSLHRISLPRRHQAHHADSVLGCGMFHHGVRSLQSRRTIPDAGLRHVRSRSRHEQLDVRSFRISQPRRSSAAKFSTRKTSTSSAASLATKIWTAMA